MSSKRVERSRSSRHRAADTTRRDGIHPGFAIASLLCVVALIAVVFALSGSDRMAKPMAINGDQLGPDYDENLGAYALRAKETLDDARVNNHEQQRWALVSFTPPASIDTAAAAVSNIDGLRVAQVLMGPAAAVGVPEPTGSESRADVFTRVRELTGPMAGFEPNSPELDFTGLVVYGNADQLVQIAERKEIFAVEALPTDARAGHFGVQPLVDPEER